MQRLFGNDPNKAPVTTPRLLTAEETLQKIVTRLDFFVMTANLSIKPNAMRMPNPIIYDGNKTYFNVSEYHQACEKAVAFYSDKDQAPVFEIYLATNLSNWSLEEIEELQFLFFPLKGLRVVLTLDGQQFSFLSEEQKGAFSNAMRWVTLHLLRVANNLYREESDKYDIQMFVKQPDIQAYFFSAGMNSVFYDVLPGSSMLELLKSASTRKRIPAPIVLGGEVISAPKAVPTYASTEDGSDPEADVEENPDALESNRDDDAHRKGDNADMPPSYFRCSMM